MKLLPAIFSIKLQGFYAEKNAFFAAKDEHEVALKTARKSGDQAAIAAAEAKVAAAEAKKDEIEALKSARCTITTI